MRRFSSCTVTLRELSSSLHLLKRSLNSTSVRPGYRRIGLYWVLTLVRYSCLKEETLRMSLSFQRILQVLQLMHQNLQRKREKERSLAVTCIFLSLLQTTSSISGSTFPSSFPPLLFQGIHVFQWLWYRPSL